MLRSFVLLWPGVLLASCASQVPLQSAGPRSLVVDLPPLEAPEELFVSIGAAARPVPANAAFLAEPGMSNKQVAVGLAMAIFESTGVKAEALVLEGGRARILVAAGYDLRALHRKPSKRHSW